jgi:hypothetical protein
LRLFDALLFSIAFYILVIAIIKICYCSADTG